MYISLSLLLSIGSLYDVMTAAEQCSLSIGQELTSQSLVYNVRACVCDVGEGSNVIVSALIVLCTVRLTKQHIKITS